MCLILFAYRSHPKYKLIMAANRDEFYKRPTAPAHFWEDEPHILAGRDLEKLGTWMGVTRTGTFAAVTNYRDPKEETEGKRSRGELVAAFLKDNMNPEPYLQTLARGTLYPGFNLLTGNPNELYYYSNIGDKIQKLEPGIYGVSNHLLNTEWPKVQKGKAGLEQNIKGDTTDLSNRLFALLQNADPAEDHLLPNTGVSRQWERILSPLFIKTDHYGTRSSTIFLLSENEIYYRERVFINGENSEDQEFRIPF
ncbi:uncharacterized protein with NRDE domain [Bacillus oleivorans]|uniref:Uncharacterized protein with NRDE domain n=1 Tax=Bacillus oleivorans TaxID=1448271 RepID=A0A285CTA4_9BACI|nr:NRDE family protein [Bacillus oleivorans]SNX70655.1 uncharacterized protein with NRDE domain [Bacillus oleivorans]